MLYAYIFLLMNEYEWRDGNVTHKTYLFPNAPIESKSHSRARVAHVHQRKERRESKRDNRETQIWNINTRTNIEKRI